MNDQSIENRCVELSFSEMPEDILTKRNRMRAIMGAINFNMRIERYKQYLKDRQKEAEATGQTVIDYKAHCRDVYQNFINQRKPQ